MGAGRWTFEGVLGATRHGDVGNHWLRKKTSVKTKAQTKFPRYTSCSLALKRLGANNLDLFIVLASDIFLVGFIYIFILKSWTLAKFHCGTKCNGMWVCTVIGDPPEHHLLPPGLTYFVNLTHLINYLCWVVARLTTQLYFTRLNPKKISYGYWSRKPTSFTEWYLI